MSAVESGATPEAEIERIRQAIAHVESRHDPCAVSPSGTFKGMYQMGGPAASDVGIEDPSVLVCNAELATWAWRQYMRRYLDRHWWEPDWAALLWKGGPGTARKVRQAVDKGMPFDRAARELGPYRTLEYLELFRDAYALY